MLLESIESLSRPTVLDGGLPSLSMAEDNRIVAQRQEFDLSILEVISDSGRVSLALEVPLSDAEGFWHPNAHYRRTLVPDWSGAETTSAVSSAPLGSLFDQQGTSILTFALGTEEGEALLRFGVSEERKAFVVYFEKATREGEVVQLMLVRPGIDYILAIAHARDWLRGRLAEAPMAVPAKGLEPVFSTWYAFLQAVSATEIELEAALARDLGCGAVFIDDGWQRYGDGRWYNGCGDWVPDLVKFPDLGAHVTRLQDAGLAVVLWIAPLLLGELSDAAEYMDRFAPRYSTDLRAAILDPRHPEVREHIVKMAIRLVDEYGLDGLKIDFLDRAMVYAGTPTTGDIADVGVAMQRMLADLRDALTATGRTDFLIEFRQPYVGPPVAPYSNLIRAGDCPADAVVNRRSIIDTRLLAVGQAVHSDMTMWDPAATPAAAARQLLNAYFGVPQVSMRWSQLPEGHRRAVADILEQWRRDRKTVLEGTLSPGLASENFPVIVARRDASLVVGVYEGRLVDLDLDGISDLTILNVTNSDSIVVRLSLDPPMSRGCAGAA